jgi:uncharacterized BrkB/YihY/UPF0761 family membrane protein
MARTLLRWLPIIVWAALFNYLDRYHFIVMHYNALLIILLASVMGIVLIYKYVLKESQKP